MTRYINAQCAATCGAPSPQICGYSPHHPWYYLLGGPVFGPKSIARLVEADNYFGFASEIDDADKMAEPKRSEALRKLRRRVLEDYQRDLRKYREIARALRYYREKHVDEDCPDSSAPIHTSISLKFSHLYNDLAHLRRIDDALKVQADLFEMI